MHLSESYHVYIQIYLSGSCIKKKKRMQPRADSKLLLGHGPKPLYYAFNISSLFPILQIIYDYQLLNLGMIIIKNS